MDFGDKLGGVFENYIGRVVAFVLTPLLVVAAPPVTNALNEALGTGFNDQQISNVAIATIVGIALAAWQWLRNRGNWEAKVAELHELYEAGQQHLANQAPGGGGGPVVEDTPEPPVVPPGMLGRSDR